MCDYMGMTDKQYEGMLKDQVACLDRIAKVATELDALKAIYEERKLVVLKIGYDVEENGLYDKVK